MFYWYAYLVSYWELLLCDVAIIVPSAVQIFSLLLLLLLLLQMLLFFKGVN